MKEFGLFQSYAHVDNGLAEKLHSQVDLYFKADKLFRVSIWRDKAILPGEDWHATIQTALKETEVGLLLLSPAFFGSGYIREHELREILATPGKIAIPVMLRQIDFARMDLQGVEDLQVFRYEGASYEECNGAKRSKFEMALYQAMHDRLVKEFGA